MRLKPVVLLLFLLIAFKARSQFNDSTHYHFKGSSTGVLNNTKESSSFLLSNGLSFQVMKKKMKLNLAGSYVYGQENSKLTNDDINSSLDFNIYATPRFYYWGLGTYTKSYSLKVRNRYQTGLGVAATLWEKPFGSVNLSDGILYEYADLMVHDTVREIYSTFRNSFRLMYQFSYKDFIRLEGTHFYQQSLARSDDYILKSTNSLFVKLTTWLQLKVAMEYNRVNRTAAENIMMNYGFTIEQYF